MASKGLCAESITPAETITQMEQSVVKLKESTKGIPPSQNWAELNKFNTSLWRAMSLDPTPVYMVPVSQVPKNLFAAELNADLEQQWKAIKASTKIAEYRAQIEFDQYATAVDTILTFRHNRQFPQARAVAKRGVLDEKFEALHKKISEIKVAEETAGENPEYAHLNHLIQSLKELNHVQTKEAQKKEIFTNGNQFIWFALAAIFGFFLGIAGYRAQPNFFQKFVDKFETPAPTATTHPAGARLDYARWLKEFEEILSRLKSSQLTHERRIEEITSNSEKITQHALSLYSDARIKNEANLEYRMATLLREIQNQFEQSQKLKAGDRVQMGIILEHCLALCDGIESNSIVLDLKSTKPMNQ